MPPTLFSYLPKDSAVALCKFAEEEAKKKSRTLGVAKAVGVPLVGLAGGTLGGFGAGLLADKLYQKATGTKIPAAGLAGASALLGTGLGLAYSMYKAHELEDLRRVFESTSDAPVRGGSK